MNKEILASESKFGPQRISEIDIRDSENVIITQKQIIQISVDEIKTREFFETSPYKGLKKFESGDKDLFFGREQLLADLVGDLEKNSLILLLGASGSGKSSVVRAGIVPWFTRKYGAKSILAFTPGQNPFESLYACLLTNEYSIDEVKFVQQSKTDTLLKVAKKLKPKEVHWLIFIDQFEQIFTRTPEEKRRLFLESLVGLIKQQDKSVKLIMTMRADFLDRFTPYPKFGKLTEKRIRLMTDMDEHELRLAIEQPAAQHGVVFEKGLVEEIIKDVQGQAGYLPLLQYTLDILWKDEQSRGELDDRTLNINTYRTLGGVAGTLQKRVEEIYQDFSKKGLDKIVQQIFLKLVDFDKMDESGVVGKPVSRRVSRSEFTEDKQIHQVIDQLISPHRLLVGDREEQTTELAHESLLSNWDTLQGWIQEHYEVIYWRNRLVEERERWEKTKFNEDFLRGSKLEKVLELRESNAFAVLGIKGLEPEDNQFINASVESRDRTQAEKTRLQRRAIKWLFGGLIVALFAAGVAVWQWTQSEEQKKSTNSYLQKLLMIVYEDPFKFDFLLRKEVTPLIQEITDNQKLSKKVRAGAINYLGNGYYFQATCDEGVCFNAQERLNQRQAQELEKALASNIQKRKEYLEEALELNIAALEILPTYTPPAHDAALACQQLMELEPEPEKAEMWRKEALKYWRIACDNARNDSRFSDLEPVICRRIKSLESRN